MTEDGGHVYTDRECKEIGATERAPRPGAGRDGSRLIRRDCSRRLQDLVFELTAAIDSRDVNRLAGIYHWPGTSARNAYAIMGRLDAIVNRPLLHITPLQPSPPPRPAAAPPPAPLTWRTRPDVAGMQAPSVAAGRASTAADAALPESVHAAATRHQRARQVPTGLVLDQTVANRITPLQTVLSLRRHLGCWWVSL
ncbi:DUF4124 domain-containing protein [Luteimonas viscosa]|uniref:DUF4124 domain-containing protein n=1 Tax=Luteimonas viscosa TaxID=1132694 RepID=A0A5D4XM54_9GAMM|nr:DUF4124 domain-containing protein [Luteimonas viscosa]TYT25747.1 DUF4124 domain-containing protein [Luteimonas viscosa]